MPGRNHALKLHQCHRAAELYRSGQSRREVAAQLGVSDMAVRSGLRVVGQPMRPRRDAIGIAMQANPSRFKLGGRPFNNSLPGSPPIESLDGNAKATAANAST